jgi:hypothetical protein
VGRLPETVPVKLDTGQTATLRTVTAAAGAQASLTVDMRREPTAPSSWRLLAIEYHGDQTLSSMASSMRTDPVVAQPGSTQTVQVESNGSTDTGIFPLLVLSHSSSGALHIWVGTISRN